MRRSVFLAVLGLLISMPAVSQPMSAQCQKSLHDLAMVYVYGVICADEKEMQSALLGIRQDDVDKFLEKTHKICPNTEDAFEQAVNQLVEDDPKLQAVLEEKAQPSSVCPANIPTVKHILFNITQ